MHPGTAEPPPSSSQLPGASRSASRLAASLTRRLRARSARPRPPGAAAEPDRRRGAPRGGERGRGGVENGSGRRVTKGGGRRAWSRVAVRCGAEPLSSNGRRARRVLPGRRQRVYDGRESRGSCTRPQGRSVQTRER